MCTVGNTEKQMSSKSKERKEKNEIFFLWSFKTLYPGKVSQTKLTTFLCKQDMTHVTDKQKLLIYD